MTRLIEDYESRYLRSEHLALLNRNFPDYCILGSNQPATLLEGGEDNVNLLLRDAAGEARFVARHYLISPPSKIAQELSLVSMLAANGYPTPPSIRTSDGELFLERQNEPSIAVFHYVQGATSVNWSNRQRFSSAAMIARFHHLCRSANLRLGATRRRLEKLQENLDYLIALKVTGYEKIVLDVNCFLKQQVVHEWGAFQSLPVGPVHHDLNYGNIIWRDDEIVAVIDFDECHDAPLIMDVVAALSYLALTSDYRLDYSACEAIIGGFQSVRWLESEELRLLPFAWELLNLCDALQFILANHNIITSVDDCRSYSRLFAERFRFAEFMVKLENKIWQ